LRDEESSPRVACVRVIVGGRVQGVSFRSSMREVARRHRVNGWVRNNPDGSVEAMLQGRVDGLNRVLDWARHGPPSAVVTEFRVEFIEPSTDLGDFQVQL